MKKMYEVYTGQDGREFRRHNGGLLHKNGYDAWIQKSFDNEQDAIDFAKSKVEELKNDNDEFYDIVFVQAQCYDDENECIDEQDGGCSADYIFCEKTY